MALSTQLVSLVLFFFFCIASSQTTQPCGSSTPTSGTCSASVSVQPTQPGRTFMYDNINVKNTGSCAITKMFVNITLPPYANVFAYYNVSNQTGELLGLPASMVPGSTSMGGVIVMNDARIPIVEMSSVECDPACMGESESQSKRSVPSSSIVKPESQPTKIEVQWGANSWWIALHLIDDFGAAKEVRLSDSGSVSQQLMKREKWSDKLMYTFSGVELALPLSLELTSIQGDKIILENIITTFTYDVLNTELSF